MFEVTDKDRRKVFWELINDYVVGEGAEHEELGIRGFDFNLSDEDRKQFPTGDWWDQIDQMNKKVDEDNGRGGNQENGIFQKLWRLSTNKFWKKIGCLISAPIFGIGGSILW